MGSVLEAELTLAQNHGRSKFEVLLGISTHITMLFLESVSWLLVLQTAF